MSPEEVEALLVEMEPEIRPTDRHVREIEMLEQRGVTAAGKLARKSCTSLFDFGDNWFQCNQTTRHCSLIWMRF